MEVLTTEFGMGSGVAPPLWSPGQYLGLLPGWLRDKSLATGPDHRNPNIKLIGDGDFWE